jgi:hypothetical protein
MANFFPPGFWSTTATIGMVVFFILGLDLFFGAKLMSFLSAKLNKSFQVDKIIMHALEDLKSTSDKHFDVDKSIIQGWGRFVMGGMLLFGAGSILLQILPNLSK